MKKNYFLLLFALLGFAGKGFAQIIPCATDEMHKRLIAEHPELIKIEADYEKQIAEGLKKIDFSNARKTTVTDQLGNPDFWYDLPIVVHVVHDYGAEYISDDSIFDCLIDWNRVYAHQNYDTINVIAPFIKYEGNPHIRLHFATKDPNGNPSKGITRHRNYNTYYGGEQAKFDDWTPTSYVNIWVVNVITSSGGVAAAYSAFPASVTSTPFYDGVICDYGYVHNWYGDKAPEFLPYKTINHEMGHYLSLYHPWGNSNNAGLTCGDDAVDDTPPTKGHTIGGLPEGCGAANIYDTTCARNYFKLYPSVATGLTDSLVDYPDTTNAQNIMDYTFCSLMFTKGQVFRMHQALNSDVAGRNNLWNPSNLYFTGVLADSNVSGVFVGRPDLKPIPEFSAVSDTTPTTKANYMNFMGYFAFPNTPVYFRNESWNDTLSNLTWTFGNSALYPTYSSDTHANALRKFGNTFADPGWADVKMSATGNNQASDTTVDWPRAIFVADATGTPGPGFFEDFNNADTAKWPTFNYYNNNFKWQSSTAGFGDNTSMEYVGYDERLAPLSGIYPTTGNAYGDFDDMFSIPMDLSSYSGSSCSLNYYFSGASRSSSGLDINDALEISYSTNKSKTWKVLSTLTGISIDNKGSVSTSYVPTSTGDWEQMSINVPPAALTPYTVFRFRYKPSVAVGFDGTVGTGTQSSGNNFYMDKLFFSPYPAGVANVKLGDVDVAVAPNPTTGDAYVIVKDASNALANVVVSDITGKVVYKTSAQVTGGESHIMIPHSAISVSGMYFIQTSTGQQTRTLKLVVQ